MSGKNEIVAESCWHSSDPNAFLNGIPLGPNAAVVSVVVPKFSKAFLWRPSADMTYIEDAVKSKIAWPANRLIIDKTSETIEEENISSDPVVNIL